MKSSRILSSSHFSTRLISFLFLFLFFLSSFSFNISTVLSFSYSPSSNSGSSAINLDFSTFLGGSADDIGNGVAVDSQGNIYVTGYTNSINFPTLHAFQSVYGGSFGDAFVAKFNSTGNLIFSTFLGGSGYDSATAIAVDILGNIYVTGTTTSSDFPTKNAFQSIYGGGGYNEGDIFVTKFDPSGNLLFSTFLGGSGGDIGSGIAVDNVGNIYVTGSTNSYNFPIKNAFQSFSGGGYADAFVAKFTSNGNLVFSTFLGGNSYDQANDIVVDAQGNSFITGITSSYNFPTKNAYNSTFGGPFGTLYYGDVFVTKFNSTGNLIFSTFLGGSGPEWGTSISIDSHDNSFITGYTYSNNFPMKNAYNSTFGGGNEIGDLFVAKFDSTGNLVFSTFLGSGDYGEGIAVDSLGNCYITGFADSSNFPTKYAFQSSFGIEDVFVAKFDSTGNLIFSSFLGGTQLNSGFAIAVDSQDNIYVTGSTGSSDFPAKNAYNSTYSGGTFDAFVTKFSPSSSSSGNPHLLFFIPTLASNIIYLAGLSGILIIVIVILIEFRKYLTFKQKFANSPQLSFYKFLINKIPKHKQKSPNPDHLSDQTFTILNEIEKENTPKE